MSTLTEIEAVVDTLSLEQKQELLLFISASLRAPGAKLPKPRQFTPEEIASWIAEDEAGMRRFSESK